MSNEQRRVVEARVYAQGETRKTRFHDHVSIDEARSVLFTWARETNEQRREDKQASFETYAIYVNGEEVHHGSLSAIAPKGEEKPYQAITVTSFRYEDVGGLTLERVDHVYTAEGSGNREIDKNRVIDRLLQANRSRSREGAPRIHRVTVAREGQVVEHISLPHTKQGEDTKPHWTDPHILFEENEGKFIAYDEAGLEHSKWDSQNEARDALVIYAANELECKIKKYKSAPVEQGGEL